MEMVLLVSVGSSREDPEETLRPNLASAILREKTLLRTTATPSNAEGHSLHRSLCQKKPNRFSTTSRKASALGGLMISTLRTLTGTEVGSAH
eukprot:6201520-Amphidinium_carterae.1